MTSRGRDSGRAEGYPPAPHRADQAAPHAGPGARRLGPVAGRAAADEQEKLLADAARAALAAFRHARDRGRLHNSAASALLLLELALEPYGAARPAEEEAREASIP